MNKSTLSMNHFYYRPQYPQIIHLPLENSTSYRIQIITILKWILLNQKNHQNEVESRHHQNTHQATHLNLQFFTFGIFNFGAINGKEVDFWLLHTYRLLLLYFSSSNTLFKHVSSKFVILVLHIEAT